MKELTKYITIIYIIFGFISCERNDHATHEGENINYTIGNSPKAKVDEDLIVNKINGNALSIEESKKENYPGRIVLVKGIIGGRVRPFTDNRASFILGDLNLKTCDKIPGDNCPTPWDACCEDRAKLLLGTMSVQVLDNNGTLIHGSLNGVGGLKPGAKIKVKGIVDQTSIKEAMVLNAKEIQLI